MECPFCTATVPEDDLFCEECGKPVHPAVPPPPAVNCPHCEAPAEEIADDGYCGRCGHLARRPASDRVEVLLSADFVGISDRGIRHQRNEDRFAMRQAGSGYALIVCDGVSSSTQSEQASSSVAEHVAQSFETALLRHSASSPERTVRLAIQDAQSALAALPSTGAPDPASTTVVAALVTGMDAIIGWAGDSRAYWIGPTGETRQLTTDHSWMNEVVASGAITPEEAARSPHAHGITRWLGADAAQNAEPEVTHFKIPGPGYLLLCTDGLWNYDPPLSSMLDSPDPLIEIARALVAFANEKGGHDNITVTLLRVIGNTDFGLRS